MSFAGPWPLAIPHYLALAALAVDMYAGMLTDSYPPFRLTA